MSKLLVDDWQQFPKWLSTWGAVIAAAWSVVPAELAGAVPLHWKAAIAVTIMVLTVIGRLINQGGKT